MKRAFLLLVLLLLCATLRAQTSTVSPQYCPVPPVDSTLSAGMAARDNLWPGFGTGSRRQSDMESARVFKTVDAFGTALIGVGSIGVVATAMQRCIGPSTFGYQSNTSYFIFGGVAAAGIATLVTSRVLAVRRAREYDKIIFPTAVPGGAGLAFVYSF